MTVEVPQDQGSELVHLKVDCAHHMRNFIIEDVSKSWFSHAKEKASDGLNDTDFSLRVKVDIMCVTRLVDK